MQGSIRQGPRTVPFRRSVAGGPWEDVAEYRLRRRQFVAGPALTAVGDRLVVPVVGEILPDKGRIEALLVRTSGMPAGQPWKVWPVKDLPGDEWWNVQAFADDARTVALGTWGAPTQYLFDVTTGHLTRMPAPTDEPGWNFEAEKDRIFAWSPGSADAWVTEDRGTSWERLSH